ncbi:peptidoglycan DD-metalloendopeptidase family protein [Microbacterium sp. CIAB417]|uniref:peptidoglycan DD-metalloendopeptidase family protein n=1 Tax=Microbacterium sp. CIAB417 TaxID=2860287 RepID=UPI001FAD140B
MSAEDLPGAEEDCGCGPTAQEKRALWPTMTRRVALGAGALGVVGLAALAGPLQPQAFAIEGYPSWDDVQRAKNNEAAKGAEIQRIETLIAQLQADVAAKQAIADQKSQEYFTAQQAYFDAAARADNLQSQADAQAAAATEAANKAGRVASQLYKAGGDDTSLQLFFAGSAAGADDLLARLGTMDKLLERNQDVYASAVSARNAAQSLTDQATTARDERDKLQQAAEQAMQEAQAAADAAQAALDAQNQNLGTLQAQLAALKDTTAKTVADYQAGVAEQKRREEEARKAAEEAARRAAEEAAKNNPGGGSSSSGGGGGGGSGWVRPAGGSITSEYGPRYSQCGPSYCASSTHYGTDFGAGCWGNIYAASSGTVTYAGYNGGYGNYIRIDHGGGIGTGYAHISNGGIYVSRGQWVNAGQVIAGVGNTGNSFGCHLHFEVYTPSGTVNPRPFMAARGVGF